MGVLFWYMSRQYAKVFALCLSGLLTVYLVVDFFEKLRKFLKYDADLPVMLMYFVYRVPDIVFQLAPLAALMSALLTVGFLCKSHEITAMRSCGMSFAQIAAPFVGGGLIASAILYSFTAVVVPLANVRAEFVRTALIGKKPEALSVTPDRLWLRLGNASLLKIGRVQAQGEVLKHLALYRINQAFQLREIIESDEARYAAGGWEMRGVTERIMADDGRVEATGYPARAMELPLTPEDFRTWLAWDPKNMTLGQLGEYIARLERDGHGNSRYATDYFGRVAFSAVTVVMTLLGLSIALLNAGTRGQGVAKGIGQALGIGFLFWVVHSFGIVLGRNGAIPPVVAGWFACVMFLVLALNLCLRTR